MDEKAFSVGLITMMRAPAFFASMGKEAAGYTTPDVPSTSMTSHFPETSKARGRSWTAATFADHHTDDRNPQAGHFGASVVRASSVKAVSAVSPVLVSPMSCFRSYVLTVSQARHFILKRLP